jgi:hypothetical protein
MAVERHAGFANATRVDHSNNSSHGDNSGTSDWRLNKHDA